VEKVITYKYTKHAKYTIQCKNYCKYFIYSVMFHLHTYKFSYTVQAVCT